MSPRSSIECDVVLALVPTFVDGEVAESVGGTVRRHLMDCPACRAVVQEEQTMRQWFVPGPEVDVPAGFAAHVARRAFAGDVGQAPVSAPQLEAAPDRPGGRVLAFSRALVAVAAGGLVAGTLILSGGDRPAVGDLDAGKNLEEALSELEAENLSLELEASERRVEGSR